MIVQSINLLVKNFLIYSFGSILLRCTTFLLLPFLITVLTPTELGLWALINSFMSIFVVFIGLGLRQFLWLEYFHNNAENRKNIINNIIYIYLIFSLPIFIILFFNTKHINNFIFFNDASCILIYITLICAFINFFNELLFQLLRCQGQIFELTQIQFASTILTILSSIFFVIFLRWSIMGMALSSLLGMLIPLFYGLFKYYKKSIFNYYKRPTLKLISYYIQNSLPFIPGMLSAWFLASSSRWMIAFFGNLQDVGIFSIADLSSQIYDLAILQPLQGSYLPYLLSQFASNKENARFKEQWNKKIMYASLLFMNITILFAYLALKPIALRILPINYHEAINYSYFIMVGSTFLMASIFACAYAQFLKHTKFLAVAWCIPTVLNIIFSLLLVPTLKTYGLVIAGMCSYMIYFCITLSYNYYLVKRHTFAST